MTALVVLAVVAVLASLLAPAYEPVSGPARASDGDSFHLGAERIRLLDIDAPELDQVCQDVAGADWPCGRVARNRMARLLAAGEPTCTPRDRDRYGRLLAYCSADGKDLAAEMVSAGLAVADGGYRHEEARARQARTGLWAGTFQSPRAWRDGKTGANPWGWLGNLF